MGKNLKKLYSFRTTEELIENLNKIAEKENRTRNNLIEKILMDFVQNYQSVK